MTLLLRITFALLHGLLALYPARYRREYEEERACVLQLALKDASKGGLPRVIQVCAREMRDLPSALLREHYKEWRLRMNGVRRSTPLAEWGPSGRQLALFLVPFLIVLIVPLGNWFKVVLSPIPALVLLAVVLALGIIGLVKGLPGWALPSVGLAMSLLKLLFFIQWVYEIPGLTQLKNTLWTDFMPQRVLYALIVSILSWLPTVLLLVVIALLVTWLPGFSILRQRLQQDWTLLPFLLYATNLLTPLYADAYRRFEPYQLLFVLMMAGGAWYSLWTSRLRYRLIALLTVTLLSGLVLALGIYQIYPLQTWADDVVHDFPRWWEALQPLLDTLALLGALLTLAVFGRLLGGSERQRGAAI
jgi:hypothetical protein